MRLLTSLDLKAFWRKSFRILWAEVEDTKLLFREVLFIFFISKSQLLLFFILNRCLCLILDIGHSCRELVFTFFYGIFGGQKFTDISILDIFFRLFSFLDFFGIVPCGFHQYSSCLSAMQLYYICNPCIDTHYRHLIPIILKFCYHLFIKTIYHVCIIFK